MTPKELIQALKEFFTANPLRTNHGITSRAMPFNKDGSVSYQGGVVGYEFYNLTNTPVIVNGMWLDRYFSGSVTNPTVISGSKYFFIPPRKSGERDTGFYDFKFQQNFYGGGPVQGNLYVVRILESKPVLEDQF